MIGIVRGENYFRTVHVQSQYARLASNIEYFDYFEYSISATAVTIRPRITAVGLVMPPPPAEAEYPAHIDRRSIDALPCKPGVYLFRDRNGAPVYIGKSVNLRARVLSHLRAPEEAGMLREARAVDFLRTAGEIGALLLESKLIKQWQPPYNVLLRDPGEIFAIGLAADGALPVVAGATDPDFSGAVLYGLFASRAAAGQGLRMLIRQHRLCPALTGIETVTRGRACFSHQVGHCLGACIGRETPQAHQRRLRFALEQLQASVWPYAGPIGIIEESEELRQIHVIDRWSYVETLHGRRRRFRQAAQPEIDIDVYKILARPLADGALRVMPMAPAPAGRKRGNTP